MSGLTKRVRGANMPPGTDRTGVVGGGHSTVSGGPPPADLVTKLLSAFTDDVEHHPLGDTVAGEGDR